MVRLGFEPASGSPERRAQFDLLRRITQAEERLDTLFDTVFPSTPWTNATLNVGWTNGTQAVQYSKIADRVFVRGTIAWASGPSNPLTTLPVGYRPPNQTGAPAVFETVTPTYHALRVVLLTNGQIHINGLSATNGTVDLSFSFSTIT